MVFGNELGRFFSPFKLRILIEQDVSGVVVNIEGYVLRFARDFLPHPPIWWTFDAGKCEKSCDSPPTR